MTDHKIVHATPDGTHVEICVSDCLDEIAIRDPISGKTVGSIEFTDGLLTHASIDEPFQRKGIGTVAMEFLKTLAPDEKYFFRVHDGHRYDDASQLSNEGAAWVTHLVAKALIQPMGTSDGSEGDDWD
jgi:GNAT superfamily N-acetyltransferase